MKFFLDTANLDEIREGAALGLVDGVTTNPSLVAKEGGVDFKQHVAAICEIVQGDVSAEVTSLDTAGMLPAFFFGLLRYSAAMRTSGAAARTSASTWFSNRTKLSWNMRTSLRAVWSNSDLFFQVLNG